jgi:FAD/FMN-containing dehydrogenase
MAAGLAVDEDMAAAHRAQAQAVATALEPWSNGRRYFNMQEHPIDARALFDDATLDRLRAIRARVDPAGLLHANHPIGR